MSAAAVEWRTPEYWRDSYARARTDAVVAEWPPPVLTAAQSYELGWSWWPNSVVSLQRHAERHGWSIRTGFSRGFIPGVRKGEFVTYDLIGLYVDGHGYRGGAFWSRRPDSEAVSAQDWKAAGARLQGSNGLVGVGHTLFRKFLAERAL